MAAFGLRGKSLLALLLACLLALLPAGLIGWQLVQKVHGHFAQAFASNVTELNREKIYAPISRELALALRLARSEITRQWLLDEQDPDKRELFFLEAEGYRRDFRDHAYFIAPLNSLNYYFNSDAQTFSTQPRYRIDTDDPANAWFSSSLATTDNYNLNVDHNWQLNTTRLWLNILVRDANGKPLALAGSGLDLSNFIAEFIASEQPGVTPMILDRNGAIQAHQDRSLIALNSGANHQAQPATMLPALVGTAAAAADLQELLAQAAATPGSLHLLTLPLQGREQLLAVTYVPELNWYIANAIDLSTANILGSQWLWPLMLMLVLMLLAVTLIFAAGIERLVLRPLTQLRHSAQALAAGHYEVRLPSTRNDEIGELSDAFAVMVDKVHSHTRELESRVQERTHELQQANREMASAHQKIRDSIDYASLIQRSILPDRPLLENLGDGHAILWRPRDVVGGDFYIFRELDEQKYLLGVVDCAGHGVPGALMTMLAHAALDQAISDCPAIDPAAILQRTDEILRGMLSDTPQFRSLATSMDAGLVYVDRRARQLYFSGAKISLYYSDGEQIEYVAGGRRALADKRVGEYHNMQVALRSTQTFYLSTDGFLDQAGGDQGFGFGNRRFADMLREHAQLPLAEQKHIFSSTLARYQGDHQQRDDITMLLFRFD
ncbi:Serine phosphatase RsbU, regulator of sigma subunit [Halopseudomonas litoralis]|uniref:Serine phosphatase RsbU, regulator of sigma subunit n=1 Tax=Halopseudomonas litoralis TaxID=797277 RepID=A0A1H1XJQ6_9GAMM|nr:biofilm regulation protein phosphatase SiaA [Halopseudomonas litoralis]SDT09440.1 Serine phosphatase RsbU, regulator of sigma subunit [Halopseudomonas litoralis]